MPRPQPGWSVAFCAAALSASTWAPWLTTSGGHANAVGGAVGTLPPAGGFGAGQAIVLLASVLLVSGAMVGRGLSPKVAAGAALAVSLLIGLLVAVYYQHNVTPPVSAGYGLLLAAVSTAGAVGCSVWALVSVLRGGLR